MNPILVPTLGESVTEATVSKWLKKEGQSVKRDEPVLELETDKVTLEVNAPSDGVVSRIIAGEGQTVGVGAILGELSAANDVAKPAVAAVAPTPAPSAAPVAAPPVAEVKSAPAARKIAADNNISVASVPPTGPKGNVTKDDVQNFLAANQSAPTPKPAAPAAPRALKDREERVRMTKLRQVIAGRLKEAQNTAAILTTYNEVDMTAVMEMRNEYKDVFEKKHGTKLGFMSFFVKAAIQALKEFPAVNAEIDGTDIIYKNYYDIGVAVSTPQGLIVPVVRDADQLSMAKIEGTIVDLGNRARDGKLKLEEMQGGTFTITNGGVFGSLMSMPILNTPQSGILGMHKIQQRPMVMKDGKIEARPMMYLAFSYDHRIIDGREAVGFLVRVKEAIENPQRMLLDV
jgi:2-oxoglutarate dehydrogenase E2 component (dihydrolipoamide succinyltransferase)